MGKVDLWDMPVEVARKEEPLVEHETHRDEQPNENTPAPGSKKRSKYVIHAGTNKIGRQLYLNGYDDDPEHFDISVVPYVTTKTRCYELIALAKKKFVEGKTITVLKRANTPVEYEIFEYHNEECCELTPDEIIAKAMKMKEDYMKGKKV